MGANNENLITKLIQDGCDLRSICKAIAINHDTYAIANNIGYAECCPNLNYYNCFMVNISFDYKHDCEVEMFIYPASEENLDIDIAFILGCLKVIVPIDVDINVDREQRYIGLEYKPLHANDDFDEVNEFI